MGKKILFAVMALLVMATGKIWAQDTAEKKAYAVLYQNTENAIGSLYFMYTNEDVTKTSRTAEIKNGGSSDATTTITLTYSNHWEVPNGEISIRLDIWTKNPDGITQVVFEDSFKDVKVTDCSDWFDGLKNLTEIIGIENLNTSEVTDMGNMFYNCSSLKSLDLSSFDTSNVTDMSSMFNGCSSLTELDLRSFNTSAVTDMGSMFFYCEALTSLDLSSFNTSSVTNMMSMFNGCQNLSNLTLGSFDMTHVNNINNKNDMFYDSNITANGNALVFVTSDAQKNIWEGITEVNLMVKNGAYKYEGNGTVDITLNNGEDTPVIFPHNFTANSVTFTRTFTKGKPHTVCLPFAVNATEYGTFYKLSGYDKVNRKVKFTKVDVTEANKPYLFIPDKDKADVTEIKVTGDVDISSTADGEYSSNADNDYNTRFYGVYVKKTFTEQDLNSNYDIYGWTAAGDFKKATAGASVAPCRAFIRLPEETTGGSAPARLSVEFDDGETTGIDTIGTAKSTADGGADAPMYNLQGQRVSGGYKGVVIKNGKKMIVR